VAPFIEDYFVSCFALPRHLWNTDKTDLRFLATCHQIEKHIGCLKMANTIIADKNLGKLARVLGTGNFIHQVSLKPYTSY